MAKPAARNAIVPRSRALNVTPPEDRGDIREAQEAAAGSDEPISLDFAVVNDLDELKPEQRKLFILVGTSDGCGFLAIGKAPARLEQEEAGLGRSFYIVLARVLNQWMYVYDAARMPVRVWRPV